MTCCCTSCFNPRKYASSKSWVLIRFLTSNIMARNSSLYRATEDRYRRSNKRDWWRRAWCKSRNSVSTAWQKSYHVQIPNLAQFSLATDRHHVNAFPVSSVTAILTISMVCVTPATSQNCWMLNVQLASFVASPSNFSGSSNLIFEPVSVPGPVATGAGAGGAGGGACCAAVYAACHRLTTSAMRSLAVYGTLNDTWVT